MTSHVSRDSQPQHNLFNTRTRSHIQQQMQIHERENLDPQCTTSRFAMERDWSARQSFRFFHCHTMGTHFHHSIVDPTFVYLLFSLCAPVSSRCFVCFPLFRRLCVLAPNWCADHTAIRDTVRREKRKERKERKTNIISRTHKEVTTRRRVERCVSE